MSVWQGCVLGFLPVFLQQAFTYTKHTHHPGGCYDLLPALLTGVLREVASDDIAGVDSLQQLLRLLQTSARQNRPGEGVLVFKQLLRPQSQLGFKLLLVWFRQTSLRALYFIKCILCQVFVPLRHNKKKYFCITLKVWLLLLLLLLCFTTRTSELYFKQTFKASQQKNNTCTMWRQDKRN